MAVQVTHATPADDTFSTDGATAWAADHTVTGLGTAANLLLGSERVKRVVFASGRGRRELVGSNGQSIGFVEVDDKGLTISIREGQAINLADAQMY